MIDVSFIVPVFNQEKYLKDCIESILKQNIKNYELILINDGSSDKSGDICKMYAERRENIIFYNQKNQGLSISRNKGLLNSKGKYIFFVDSDDQLCEIQWDLIIKKINRYRIDILGFNAEQRTENNNESIKNIISIPGMKKEIISGIALIEKYGYKKIQPMSWLYLYRRDFLIENNIMFHPGCFHEDCEFCLKSICRAKRVAYLHETLYIQRLSVNSIIRSVNIKKAYDLIQVTNEIMRFLYNLNCNTKVRREVYQYVSYLTWISAKTCAEQGGDLNRFIKDNKYFMNRLRFCKKYYIYLLILCIKTRNYKIIASIFDKENW